MKQNTKSLIAALGISFLDNFGLSIVFILFAPLILNPSYGFFSAEWSEGMKNLFLGIVVGFFPLFLFFGAPFWGGIGDRWGRKKALIGTIIGTILGHLITAVAILIQSYSFLLFARAFAGFFSGNVSLCLATISDVSSDEKTRGRNFGLVTVFLGLGWILAMFVGGYLSNPKINSLFNPVLPFYLAAGLTFIGLLIVQFLFIETYPPVKKLHFSLMKTFYDIKSAILTPQIRPILIIILIWSLGWFFTFQWFTPVALERYGVSQQSISSHLLALGLGWIIGGVLINPLLVKKFCSHSLALYATFFVAAAILISGLSTHFFFFALFFALSALAAPVALSNLLNEVSEAAPLEIQGKAMGFSQSLQALAGVIVPFAGGAIANWTITLIYPLSALLLFFSAFLLFGFKKKPYH